MSEKEMITIGAIFAGAFTSILAVWAKLRFVKKSEFVDKNGRPLFMYTEDCQCIIKEFKSGQQDVRIELQKINEKISKITESIARIEQWAQDMNGRK